MRMHEQGSGAAGRADVRVVSGSGAAGRACVWPAAACPCCGQRRRARACGRRRAHLRLSRGDFLHNRLWQGVEEEPLHVVTDGGHKDDLLVIEHGAHEVAPPVLLRHHAQRRPEQIQDHGARELA